MSSPKDPITAAYYPELAKIINNDPTAIERLEIECGMCRDKMISPEDKTCSAIIVPCGHMFCPPCLKEYREYSRTNDLPYKCPVCRSDLKGKACGCSGDKDTLFDPTQPQDEVLLARLQKEISNLGGVCTSCQMSMLAIGLRRIALYFYDPAPIIESGHMLRVRMRNHDNNNILVTSDRGEVVEQLPIPPELLEIFRIAGDSLDAAWNGPRAPGDETSPFDFEVALCKQLPEDHEDWPQRRGELKRSRLDWYICSELERFADALKDALELAKAFNSDEAYKDHEEKSRRKNREDLFYAAMWEAVRRVEEREQTRHSQDSQDSQDGRLYALAAVQVVGGILDSARRFRAFLARHLC
ncbi:hypothetical protein F52700_9304 [Fusarium sp. NRRL 52700]|nr:hypothetical protein F52700_9304 [Fusarium sp. NRRL 52700]